MTDEVGGETKNFINIKMHKCIESRKLESKLIT